MVVTNTASACETAIVHDSTRGRLLVAAPTLLDSNFYRSVVFVLEHSEQGAIGVVLNRPSELPVASAIESWADHAVEPAVVFLGGPVSLSSVIALASFDSAAADERWNQTLGGVGTVDLELPPEQVSGLESVRMFAGYAGWTGGQLEAELLGGSWFVVDAQRKDVQTGNPRELWWEVCGRQTGAIRHLSNYPHDPRHN